MANPPQRPEPAGADPIEALLGLDLFETITPGPKKALLRFARIQEYPPGSDFIRQGEYTSDFFIVLGGIVTAYRTETDGKTEVFEQLGPGGWFGELSALSNQPSLARLKADTACVLAVLDGGLFKELYKAPGSFRTRVDEQYRKRSLAQHLRVVPLLKGLPSSRLRELRRIARFETYEKGEVLAQEGAPATEVVLVRSGAVTLERAHAAGSRIAGYLMSNSSFGEHAFLRDGEVWSGTYTAMMPTDVLTLPIAGLRAAFAEYPEVLRGLQRAAELIVAEEAGEDTGVFSASGGEDSSALNDEQLEIMVHRQSVKGGEALVIDLQKCVRCNACVESCVAVHEDGVPRLSKKGNRISAEANALGKELSLTTSCYHCETPGCMMACSYGAIRRDAHGLIRFVWDNCVGCAMCVAGCPYDVIRLTPPPGESSDSGSSGGGWLANLPLVGSLFGKRQPTPQVPIQSVAADRGYHKEVEVKGKAVKCDRCEGLPFEACVYNCPCGAIERIPPALIFQGIGDFAASLPQSATERKRGD